MCPAERRRRYPEAETKNDWLALVDVGEKELPEDGRFRTKHCCLDELAELRCELVGGR
jgi:hypothetical protein